MDKALDSLNKVLVKRQPKVVQLVIAPYVAQILFRFRNILKYITEDSVAGDEEISLLISLSEKLRVMEQQLQVRDSGH